MTSTTKYALSLAAIATLAGAGGACSSQSIATMVPGVVNASNNRSLRRDLLSFGTKTLCPELLKRSVPLRLRNDDPATGRFFVRTCILKEQPSSGNLLIQWTGVGSAAALVPAMKPCTWPLPSPCFWNPPAASPPA